VRASGPDDPRWIAASHQGSTFVEVLVASAIITIAFAAITQTVLTGIMVTKNAAFTTTATLLARDKLEELRSLPFDDPDMVAVDPGGTPQEDPVPGQPEMSRLWIIEDDVPYVGMKRITVTVSASRAVVGQSRTITLGTFRTGNLATEPVTE